MAQEVEEQPVIGFQGLGSIDDEVGEILLLLAQGIVGIVKSAALRLARRRLRDD